MITRKRKLALNKDNNVHVNQESNIRNSFVENKPSDDKCILNSLNDTISLTFKEHINEDLINSLESNSVLQSMDSEICSAEHIQKTHKGFKLREKNSSPPRHHLKNKTNFDNDNLTERRLTRRCKQTALTLETAICSTPVKSNKRDTHGQNDLEVPSGQPLSILLSPIACTTKPIGDLEIAIESPVNVIDASKKTDENVEDGNVLKPLWRQRETKYRTYSNKNLSKSLFSNGRDSSSNENEDPYSLFSRPPETETLSGRKMIKSMAKKAKAAKCKERERKPNKEDKLNEKEFLKWCETFSKNLEEIAKMELVTE